ncbi:plancitoxin-1 [Halyomorpha halys]|uniref:plancitoxin-1 n=1 Tax=Halyomorpha halys TaxID=286706 RepID=UPI0006D51EF3|nr:plancitoxin-1 [Halyomorpha halys]
MRAIVLACILLTLNSVFASDSIQCKDENNNPVDWFVVYKFPLIKYAKKSLIKRGEGYMYITDTQLDDEWQISERTIDGEDSIIANTISFFNDKNKDDKLWLAYNDEGNVECYTCGHTKGFIGGGNSGGFWLVHSVPKYLQDEYPKTGLRYGQSALCISLNKTELDLIGDFFKYNKPNIQQWHLSDTLKKIYPKITAALNNQKLKIKAPFNFQKSIFSKKGVEFQGFAKSRDFHTDLYEWVAKTLGEDLYTETWINGGYLPSNCDSDYRVINIMSMTHPKLNLIYSSHNDHAKLAIAASKANPWVCIGDINRAKSQEHRGGGTVCLNNEKLWNSYFKLINSTEKCDSYMINNLSYMLPNVDFQENVL